MIRMLADENVPAGAGHRHPKRILGIEVETTHEVQIDGLPDPELLEWASNKGQLLLTMDHRTMPTFARERVAAGKSTPGVLVVYGGRTLRELVDEIELIVHCLEDDEFENQVIHIPLS